jgi:hypothetical protein
MIISHKDVGFFLEEFMNRFFIRIFVSAALLLALILPARQNAAAQATVEPGPSFSTLDVDIWPEYDQPSVLVIYHFTLKEDVSLPLTLSINIPTAAGKPYSVAYTDPADGNLYNMVYSYKTNGSRATVSFTTTVREIQLEYYDPNLLVEGTNHQFEFTWPGDYTVQALSFHVQQPVSATEMKITPSLGTAKTSSDGLSVFYGLVGSYQQGQSFKLSLNYQKANSDLTITNLTVQPSAPLNEDSAGRETIGKQLPVIIGAFVILLICFAGWWIWLTRHDHGKKEIHKRRARKAEIHEGPSSTPVEEDEATHCPQCGQRVKPNDVFCRSCGTRIKD